MNRISQIFSRCSDMILDSLYSLMSVFSHRWPHKSVLAAVLFLLEWRATQTRDLPQEMESISFRADTFTSILTIPPRVAGVVNRGEMKEKLELLLESKQRENYICDHRARLLTKQLGSLQLGNLFMLLSFHVPVLSLSGFCCKIA